MRARVVCQVAALLLLSACRMSEQERRELLESAQKVDFRLAGDTTLRALAAPQDSGRLIYGPIENLEKPDTASADTTAKSTSAQ